MEVNLNIEKNEIDFVKNFLKGKTMPVEMNDVVYNLALFITEENRKDRVKAYNPFCEYQVDDLIFKEYPGKLPVGSKKYVEIEGGGVVLKVVEVRNREDFSEIKLIYEGTSPFKKYADYMERQKIELLLPHREEDPPEEPEYISQENDPRQSNAPLIEKDFKALRKRLLIALHKEKDIAFICDKVLLISKLEKIDDEIFNKIREFLESNKKSETTEFFVENFVKVKKTDDKFDAFCFAINYRMKVDYKFDFEQTVQTGWGKWNLISVIYYMKKNSLISQQNPLLKTVILPQKQQLGQRRKKIEESVFHEDLHRYYLTQREITAGAIRLRSGSFDFSESIEFEALDENTKKKHVLYHYKEANLVLGLGDIFEHYKALQGMILTFKQMENGQFMFNIRTTKKGTISDKVEYDPEKKAFQCTEDKVASPVFVNKSIFLESEVFHRIYDNIELLRKIDTMNKLVHKIFLEFGNKEKNYEIHTLRLYHILDLIFPISLKMVQDIILANTEFVQSEKNPGVFYLDSDAVVEIENEEMARREVMVEEARKKQEEVRKLKMDSEIKEQEEIRKKREERRIKREQEMFKKEEMQKLREIQKKTESRKTRAPFAKAEDKPRRGEKLADELRGKGPGREMIDSPAAIDFAKGSKFAKDDRRAEKPHAKRVRKPPVEEKIKKTVKKTEKRKEDTKIDIEDLKSQIELEKLKEKMTASKKKKKSEKEKKVAYQDTGGFGSAFAAKLDEAVKTEPAEKKKKSKKSDS